MQKDSLSSQLPCYVAADLGAGSERVVAALVVQGFLGLHELSRFSTCFSKALGSGYLCWDIDSIEQYLRSKGVGIPPSFASLGIAETDVEARIEPALNGLFAQGNPRTLSTDDVRQLYKLAI